jgi:hypothetical protein
MVADELDPSVWLLVQVPAYEVEDARTVRTTIDQITDLDDRQVFWQTQCFAARTEEPQRIAELVRMPTHVSDDSHPAHRAPLRLLGDDHRASVATGSRDSWRLVEEGAPGRIRTCAPASGGRCSIP